MIEGLKPYPAYKDSGVPWLGGVPEHWEMERAKWLFRKMDRPVRDADEVVTCFRDGAVTLRKNRRVRGFTESLKEIGYQGIRRGDLVIHAMDAFAGAVGVADSDGKGTPVYSVCEPASTANAHYYAYAVREMARSRWIQALAKGIRERSTDFRFEGFGSQPVPLPPLPDQAAIVRFLDHEERRIRCYIRAKQKLIKLLEEQKQAIIDQVITAGFLSRLPLNVLGLPQQVQSHSDWVSCSVRHLIQTRRLEIQDGNHGELHPKASDYVAEGIPFLMANNVRPEALDLKHCARLTEEHARSLRIGFARSGDVLMTHKATIGQIGLVPHEIAWPFLMLTPQVTYYRTLTPDLDGKYLFWYFQSSQFREQLSILSLNQSTRKYIGLLEQRNLVICFPPRERQKEAVRMCDVETNATDLAIEDARHEIALLREYRTRLIVNVVTGKVDVREAAARLPDDAEEPEPFDGADNLTDAEEETGEDLDAVLEEAEA